MSELPTLAHARSARASPPAIWAAFARQGRWKSWALVALLGLLFLQSLAILGLLRRGPDVVVVGPEGQGTYVSPSVAGEALVRFLQEQKGVPSDITIAHFSKSFLKSFLAVTSATVDGGWQESLAMMAPALKARMEKEAKEQKLLEGYRMANLKTDIDFVQLQLVGRQGNLVHVRAVLARRRQSLSGGPVVEDGLEVDLVEAVVPRSPQRPDGLEVAEYRHRVAPAVSAGVD